MSNSSNGSGSPLSAKSPPYPPNLSRDLRRERCERHLRDFIALAWPWVEPATEYVHGWHLDAISEHLEAVTRGEIRKLLVNIPPRHCKSLQTGVFWPAWAWTTKPSTRWLFGSYSQALTIRDALKTRRLLDSPWYRGLWGDRFRLSGDQNMKSRYDNDKGGYRIAAACGGGTGEGGDIRVIDDPHDISEAESSVVREGVLDWYDQVWSTRANDPKTAPEVIIMQRVHEADLSGHVLAQGGWTHLCLPAEYDGRRCVTVIKDVPADRETRNEEGALLWPKRFGPEEIAALKRTLGPYGCTPREAPVLMADLSLRPIGDVRVGDSVVGFSRRERNDDRRGRMTLRPVAVLGVFSYLAPVVKMTLDSGLVIRCTPDHRWYRRSRGAKAGAHYAPAEIGSPLARVCAPELPEITGDDLRRAGWLGGFFDGEGSVSQAHKVVHGTRYRPSGQIKFYQGSGRNAPMCDRLERSLNHFGFRYHVSEDERKPNKSAPCYGYRTYTLTCGTRGALPLMQRFLHVVQPTKWRERIAGAAFGAKFVQAHERVVSIHPDGEERVYALKTTTGNYVVWGLASSNSAGQLQQRPAPRGGGIIKSVWFRHYDTLPGGHLMPRGDGEHNIDPWSLFRFSTVDLASSMKTSADYCVFGFWGYEAARRRLYLLDLVRDRLEGDDKMDALDRKRKEWRVALVWIESVQFQLDFVQRARRRGLPARELAAEGDKFARALSTTAMFDGGQIWFPGGAPWLPEYLAELTTFPNAEHDDQVDVTSYAAILCQSPAFTAMSAAANAQGGKPKAIDEEEPTGPERRPVKRGPLDGFAPGNARLGDFYPGRA